MADYKYSELDNYVTSGSLPNKVLDVANTARNFVCDLYSRYPGAILKDASGVVGRTLADALCQNASAAPAATPIKLVGGQCKCVAYLVRIRSSNSSGATISHAGVVNGPLGNYTYKKNPDTGNWGWWIFGYFSQDTQCLGEYKEYLVQEAGGGAYYPNLVSIEVTRNDNQPDNCGDGGYKYPGTETIPPEETTKIVDIPYRDGGSLSVPLVYAPVSFNGNLKVDVGGITFKFDLGGITIEGGDGDTDDINRKLDQLKTGLNNLTNEVGQLEDDIADIADKQKEQDKKLDDISACSKASAENTAPIPPITDSRVSRSGRNIGSGTYTITDDCRYVEVILTTFPPDSKQQFGGGAADLFYSGWFQWLSGTSHYPRQPIHFARNVYSKPMGATGYGLTFTNRSTGESVVYNYKDENPCRKPEEQ